MPSLLFVDDEPNVLSGLKRMLRSQRGEWQMAFCESGPAALKWLTENHVDAVVSDMRMPGMDGAELLSRVRDAYPDTVRIVLSGHSDQEMTLRSIGPAHQYLAKPCAPDQLKATITSSLDLHRRISATEVRRAVESVDMLPTLPHVYAQLVAEMANPSASVETAGRIISQDLGMSAKILQLVNSSFFGLPVRVSDVPHAVALLGLGVIRPLVLSMGVFGQFERCQLGGLSLGWLTAHSTRVALHARQLAEQESPHLSTDELSDVFLAGLMHDIGRLVLAQANPDGYSQLVREGSDTPTRIVGLEKELYGATHAEVGGYLLQLWGLPADLVEAVALHHTPGDSASRVFNPLGAVHVAEALMDGEVALDDSYLERLGLTNAPDRWAVDRSLVEV